MMKVRRLLFGSFRIICAIALFSTTVLFCLFYFTPHDSGEQIGDSVDYVKAAWKDRNRPDKEVFKSLFLTEKQCEKTFPGLFGEVERAVGLGPFKLKKKPDDYNGVVQGRIKDGKMYIISAQHDDVLLRVGSILHSLHRALLTSPEPIPNTVFSLSINDDPISESWSFSRSNDAFIAQNPWIMPHFSTWSWPVAFLGPLDQALRKIERIEEETPFENKIDKAMWRGTPWFNPLWDLGLRHKLLQLTEGKEWADVEIWTKDTNNTIPIVDACRYKYIIYAEGKSYSGRLPYHQACASVIITTPITFMMHHTHLLKPIFSSFLSSKLKPLSASPPPETVYPTPSTNISWPLSYPIEEANIIFVKPDWSDLEETILWLRKFPQLTKTIAKNQREMMVGNGYLSEAAEVCYWRKFIGAWSETIRVEDEDAWGEGMRWETFTLTGDVRGFR